MIQIKLSDLEPILVSLGSSTKNVSNWIARLDDLSKRLPQTVGGSARRLSYINAVEIVFLAALVKVGSSPSDASTQARYLAGRAAKPNDRNWPLREWIILAIGDADRMVESNSPNMKQLIQTFGEVPLSMIPVGAIARSVLKLFEEDR